MAKGLLILNEIEQAAKPAGALVRHTGSPTAAPAASPRSKTIHPLKGSGIAGADQSGVRPAGKRPAGQGFGWRQCNGH
jgi:hypothetical protein